MFISSQIMWAERKGTNFNEFSRKPRFSWILAKIAKMAPRGRGTPQNGPPGARP